jgi:calpain-15
MLIEKAWAKVFGSYSIIEAGNSKEVFKALTGAPTSTLFTDDKDFLEKLIVYKDKKYPMTSGTFKKMNN